MIASNVQNHYYPTADKLKLKIKKVEIPDNSPLSEEYECSEESEDASEIRRDFNGIRLREYEK